MTVSATTRNGLYTRARRKKRSVRSMSTNLMSRKSSMALGTYTMTIATTALKVVRKSNLPRNGLKYRRQPST